MYVWLHTVWVGVFVVVRPRLASSSQLCRHLVSAERWWRPSVDVVLWRIVPARVVRQTLTHASPGIISMHTPTKTSDWLKRVLLLLLPRRRRRRVGQLVTADACTLSLCICLCWELACVCVCLSHRVTRWTCRWPVLRHALQFFHMPASTPTYLIPTCRSALASVAYILSWKR